MSYADVACAQWVQLRRDLWWGAPWLSKEAAWDAVFAATEEGCDIRRVDDDCRLLNRAMRDGLPGVVRRLMAMGVNLEKRDGDGYNAMHLAAEMCPFAEVFMVLPVKLLTGRTSWGSTPLHIAVQNQNVQAVQWMLKQPCCPVEAKNGIGSTAFDVLRETGTTPEAVAIRAAFAARKRWTALRAAWVGAVVFVT